MDNESANVSPSRLDPQICSQKEEDLLTSVGHRACAAVVLAEVAVIRPPSQKSPDHFTYGRIEYKKGQS